MAGSVVAPTAGSATDYGDTPHYVIAGTGNKAVDGKIVTPVVVLDPATGLPVGASAGSPGAVTLGDGADVTQGTSTDAAGDPTVMGQLKQLVVNTDAAADHYSRADAYTAAATGTVVDMTANPGLVYSLQVKGTGAVPTHWNIVLEGSLDGTNYATILTHADTTPTADGAIQSATAKPLLYMRSRCVSVTLGSATDVTATVLAKT